MKIFVATIQHEHGINAYASRTEAGIHAQVAAFCRTYWEDVSADYDEDYEMPEGATDREIIDLYFERAQESCVIDSAELADE